MASEQKAVFSIPSILSLVAAFFSFKVGAFGGFLLAGIAIVLGALGVILSLSPRVRGGVVSLIGIFAGAIGVVAAIVKTLQAIF